MILSGAEEADAETQPQNIQASQNQTSQEAQAPQTPQTFQMAAAMSNEAKACRYMIFDSTPHDWDGEPGKGFVSYELPKEYADTGYFPEKVQKYTHYICEQNNVPYALVLAVIERESGYKFNIVGDDGRTKGYMQIYGKYHTERMEELGCTDLSNPYHNVKVGVDYLGELLEKYGNVPDALAAYNYGEKGARECLWNHDIHVYEYNSTVMMRMQEIEEELNSAEDI